MDTSAFLPKVADILQVAVADLTTDLALTPRNWDSTAILGAIAVIDETYGIVIPTNELQGCKTVGDLLALVERNLSPA